MGNVTEKLGDVSGSGKTLCRFIRQQTCRYLHRQVCDTGVALVGIANRLVTVSRRMANIQKV